MFRLRATHVSREHALTDRSRLTVTQMLVWGCLLAASVAGIMVLFGPAKKPAVKPRTAKQPYRARPGEANPAEGPTNQQIKRDQGFGRR